MQPLLIEHLLAVLVIDLLGARGVLARDREPDPAASARSRHGPDMAVQTALAQQLLDLADVAAGALQYDVEVGVATHAADVSRSARQSRRKAS